MNGNFACCIHPFLTFNFKLHVSASYTLIHFVEAHIGTVVIPTERLFPYSIQFYICCVLYKRHGANMR